jgi:uncharacterized protein
MAGEPSFEWGEDKNRLNQEKHGVAFELAQLAFFDEHRVIAEDLNHSGGEQRYYCFGWVEDGVMTVRFTWRRGAFVSSAQAIGAREREFMSERTRKYSEGEIGDLKIVEDFLPSPSELVLREDNVKITLSLSRRSVEFFKREAGKAHVPYQRMVRALVDAYAARSEKGSARATKKPSVGKRRR